MCEFCQNHERGDTLYEPSDWDGGIGFDYIRDIKYCPICGKKLNSGNEPQMGDAKPIPLSNRVTHIKDEPQTDGYISGEDFLKIFDESHTDCAWK